MQWELNVVKDKKDVVERLSKPKVFCVIDLETTGLSHTSDGITEVVALLYNEKYEYIGALINQLTNPNKKIPKIVTDITGIYNHMVKYKADHKTVVMQLARVLTNWRSLKDVYIVAHNAAFEKKFLCEIDGRFKNFKYIDTRANHLFIRDGNTSTNNFTKNYSKLKQAAEHFNIPYAEDKAHRAEYDVLVTAKVLEAQAAKMGVKKMSQIGWAYLKTESDRTKAKDEKRRINENQIRFTL